MVALLLDNYSVSVDSIKDILFTCDALKCFSLSYCGYADSRSGWGGS